MEPGHSEESWCLKILSGPHLGAELALSGERYSVGRDSDCDIVLSDGSVYPRHALLEKISGNWTITPVEGPVLVGEDPLAPGGRETLTEGVCFALGTTHIGIGPPGYDWAGKVLPSAVLAGDFDGGRKSTDAVLPVPGEGDGDGSDAVAVDGSWRRRRPALWLLGGLGGGVWIALLLLGLEQGAEALPPPPPQQQIERLLRAHPVREAVVRHSGHGWEVGGYCDTERERETLRRVLAALPFPVAVTVRSRQGVLNAADSVVGGVAGTAVHVSMPGDGILRLEGSLSSPERKAELLKLLREDVPGIRELQDRIRVVRDQPEKDAPSQAIAGQEVSLPDPEVADSRQSRIRGIVRWRSGGLVILDDLVSLPLGARVNGKWRISRIEPDRVWLRNGSRKIVRYVGEAL